VSSETIFRSQMVLNWPVLTISNTIIICVLTWAPWSRRWLDGGHVEVVWVSGRHRSLHSPRLRSYFVSSRPTTKPAHVRREISRINREPAAFISFTHHVTL